MKLFYSPIHDFIHKSVVVAEEVGVWANIEEVPVYPREPGYSLAAINPLAKVPTLALNDGTVMFGSQAITEYLDSQSTNGVHVYPARGPDRWDALTRLALADIFFDMCVRLTHERLLEEPGAHIIAWHWPKLLRSLDQMDQDAARIASRGVNLDIGQIGTLQALTFFQRQMELTIPPPAPATYDWRDGRPGLAAWFDRATERPSVATHFKQPYAGDDSAAFCQAKVTEVLNAQGRVANQDTFDQADFVAPATASADLLAQH